MPWHGCRYGRFSLSARQTPSPYGSAAPDYFANVMNALQEVCVGHRTLGKSMGVRLLVSIRSFTERGEIMNKGSIVVVDDDVNVVTYLSDLLTSNGYVVTALTDGDQLLNRLK